MVTTNSLNITATGIVKYDGAGSFTADTVTNHAVLVGGASNAITSVGPLTNGQLAIGSTGADPVAATLTAGTGISIGTGAGSITITNTGASAMPWVVVTGTTQAIAVNTGYTSNNAGAVTLTLPATAAVGDTTVITGLGAGGWVLAQNASQLIHVGSTVTTTGTGGSVASTNAFDSITITCVVANTTWVTRSEVGNLTNV